MNPERYKKLSRLQKDILRCLLANVERKRQSPKPSGLKNCIPLKDIFEPGRTPAEAAALSRSLLRLERRGLVVRTERTNTVTTRPGGEIRTQADDPPPARTTCLILTEAGEEAAKRLT